MQFLEEYLTIEMETNWVITRTAITQLEIIKDKAKKHGWHRTAAACECAINRIRKLDAKMG